MKRGGVAGVQGFFVARHGRTGCVGACRRVAGLGGLEIAFSSSLMNKAGSINGSCLSVTVLWMNSPRCPLRVSERSLITVFSSSTDFKQIYTSQRQLPTDQCESQVSLCDQLQRL